MHAGWHIPGQGRDAWAEEVVQVLARHGVRADQPIIATCGSGVTACIFPLVLASIGLPPCPVHDGSWEEWGRWADLPAELPADR